MNQIFKLSILGFLMLTILGCGSTNKLSNKEVLLRFQPKENDALTMNMDYTMTMTGVQSMGMDMTMKMDVNVHGLDKKGAFYIDNTISRMTMSMKSLMANIEYDSDKPNPDDPASNEMNKIISKMINVKITSKMDNRGTTLESPDYNKIFGDTPELKSQIDQMNNSLQNAFILYPEKPLKVGDSWDNEINIKGQVPMKQTFVYKLKEITDNFVKLDVLGDITISSDMITGTGTMAGTMVIDRKSGFLSASNLIQNMTMATMGMEMNIVNDIKITMVKKD